MSVRNECIDRCGIFFLEYYAVLWKDWKDDMHMV